MGFLSSLFGIKGSQPKTSTVVQAQKLPEEISPFVKEILGEAQDLYKAEIERGYDPYTGETIAPLTAEEEAAMAGIAGLAGTTTPFLEEAIETYRTGAEKFTPEVAQEYMSPYQRAVTDIEKREAQRTFERETMPRFEASAVAAGGLSGLGTRAGVEAAEIQRGQSQLLADIEAKGQQKAFEDARMGFEAQKARERQMGQDVSKIGPAMLQAGLAEQGAVQTVGEQKRALGQSALDEAYYRFLEEKQFPQKTLADYSGMVYSNPMSGLTSSTRTETGTPFVPSTGQQIMGMGLAGLNVFGMGGRFSPGGFDASKIWGNKEGGPVIGRAEGGSLKDHEWDQDKAEFVQARDGGLMEVIERSDGIKYDKSGTDTRGLYNHNMLVTEDVTEEEKEEDLKEEPYIVDPGVISRREGQSRLMSGSGEMPISLTPPALLGPSPGSRIAQHPKGMAGAGFGLQPIPTPTKEEPYRDRSGRTLAEIFRQGDGKLDEDTPPPTTTPTTPSPEVAPLSSSLAAWQARNVTAGGVDPYLPPGYQRTKADIAAGPGYISLKEEPHSPLRSAGKKYVMHDSHGLVQKEALTQPYSPETGTYEGTTTGPGWEGLTGMDVGYFFKHGGGLSQLANGGPVVYRQTPGQTRAGPRGIRQRVQPMVHGYPASQALAGPPSLRGGHPSMRAAHKQQLAAYNKMQQNIMGKQKKQPSMFLGPAQPFGLSGLPQGPQAPVPDGAVPGGGVPGGGVPGGGPLSVTDTVTQTIQRLGQRFLGDRPSFSKRFADAKASISGEEGFSKTKMTESFTDYQTKLKTLQKRMNAKNKAKRKEFNEADRKASEEFFAAEKKAIQSGNNADLIAGAMDEANQRQIKAGGSSLTTWATDVLNLSMKGIGGRKKEVAKDLRELAKAKYKESRTDRKTDRAEQLAEINKESLQDAKLLVDKYGFSKELSNMDRATRTAAYAKIAAIAADEKGELAQIDTMAKLLDILGKGGKGGGKPANFNDKLKGIRERVLDEYNFMIGDDGVTIRDKSGQVISEDDPSLKKANDQIDREQAAFLEDLEILGTGYGAQVVALSRRLTKKLSGQQTSSATPPPRPQGVPSNTQQRKQGNQYIWVDVTSGKAWDSSGNQLP